MHTYDLAVLGLGPAGRTLAAAAHRKGWRVIGFDPNYNHRAPQFLGVWQQQLPEWLTSLPQMCSSPWVRFPSGKTQPLTNMQYTVFSAEDLFRELANYDFEVDTIALTPAQAATYAPLVIDARGNAPGQTSAVRQVALGVVLPMKQAQHLLPDGPRSSWFMDWRDPHSFTYSTPVSAEEVLVEQTILATRSEVTPSDLAPKLAQTCGLSLSTLGQFRREEVSFPLRCAHPRPHALGTAGYTLHPATGYSYGSTLEAIDLLLASGNSAVLSQPKTRLTYALRNYCLSVELGLEQRLPEFLEYFFNLPPQYYHGFLTKWNNPIIQVKTMVKLFSTLPWQLKLAALKL